MKILYVSGYSRMILFNKLIPIALRQNGCEVDEFDWNSVWKFNKIFKIFSNSKVNVRRNSELLKKAKSVKPDFVFILKGEPFSNATLRELKKITGAKLFNWFGDDPWEFPVFSGKVANDYYYFFTYDPYSVRLYESIGHKNAYHLPYGYDPEVTEQLVLTEAENKKYECDVAFIGSHYPKREELLSKLKEKYSIKIWGRGWTNTSCADVYQGSALYGTDMLKAMKKVKILLNIHKGFEEGVEASGEGLNLRVMEGAACGAFQLSSFQKDIPKRFLPEKEISLFNTWDEALEKIEYYLSHEHERQCIAGAAFVRLKKDHTLRQRMKQVIEIVTK